MSKLSVLTLGIKKAILFLFEVFGNSVRIINNKNNHLNIILLKNLLFKLSPSIIFKKISNFLFKSNPYRFKKTKKYVIFILKSLKSLNYNMNYFANTLFYDFFAINKNNIDNIENF